jgi:hypothetical protein
MTAQLAFTAMLSGNEAVLGRAVLGLPGLAVDRECGTFATWTQANDCARQLNEGLGLSPSESRDIVTDALLTAAELIRQCDSLLRELRQLRQRINKGPTCLQFVLAELELGATFCRIACTRPSLQKERLLQNARKALSSAMSAMGRFEFSIQGLQEIAAGIDRLQDALQECTPELCSAVDEPGCR